jgi:hypothetical protein
MYSVSQKYLRSQAGYIPRAMDRHMIERRRAQFHGGNPQSL